MELNLDVIFLIVGFQGIFLAGYIYWKFRLNLAFLSSLVLLIAVDSLSHFSPLDSYLFLINHGNLLVFGPLLYLFALELKGSLKKKKILLHLLPFLIFKLILISIHESNLDISRQISVATSYFIAIYNIIYSIVTLIIAKHTKSNKQLKWVFQLSLIFMAGWFISLLARLTVSLDPITSAIFWKVAYAVAGIMIYYITILFMKERNMFGKSTYSYNTGSAISKDHIVGLIKEKELYLNPDFRINDLAEELGVGSHELSFIINHRFKTNFKELVNEIRINRFLEEIKSGAGESKTMLGIALDSGFGSKATFQRAFKKLKGVSPVEFKKKGLI